MRDDSLALFLKQLDQAGLLGGEIVDLGGLVVEELRNICLLIQSGKLKSDFLYTNLIYS